MILFISVEVIIFAKFDNIFDAHITQTLEAYFLRNFIPKQTTIFSRYETLEGNTLFFILSYLSKLLVSEKQILIIFHLLNDNEIHFARQMFWRKKVALAHKHFIIIVIVENKYYMHITLDVIYLFRIICTMFNLSIIMK